MSKRRSAKVSGKQRKGQQRQNHPWNARGQVCAIRDDFQIGFADRQLHVDKQQAAHAGKRQTAQQGPLDGAAVSVRNDADGYRSKEPNEIRGTKVKSAGEQVKTRIRYVETKNASGRTLPDWS